MQGRPRRVTTFRHFKFAFWVLVLAWPASSATLARGQRGTVKSPHEPLAMPCENCHTVMAWRPIKAVPEFDHNKTSYPLRGMHEKVQCSQCHVKLVFTDVGKNCQDCHVDVHQNKMGTNCAGCHTVQGWNVAVQQVKDHQNRFPLLGAHAALQCEDCHKSAAVGQFQGLSTACISCHQSAYQKTQTLGGSVPNHVVANFPTTCEACHSFDSWVQAKFNGMYFDHATTGFPLTGSHQLVPVGKVNACTDCHVGNNYNLTAANTVCYGCHQAAWQSTATIGGSVPNHITAGFSPPMCSACHDTVLWSDGRFDHAATGFPLQGPHMLPPRTAVTGAIGPMVNACTDCHTGGNYTAGYPTTDCYGCHRTYYTNAQTFDASAPNHVTANYPTACTSCHTTWVTTAWIGATFSHTWFRIPHNGSSCSDCHISPTNYAIFSCINACHTGSSPHTNQTSTNSHHSGVSGYTYNATICVNCHKG